MERYEDEALCRCGAWVSVTILRDSTRVQFSSSGVVCLECEDMEIHVGYNWIARQVAFVRYLPLSVDTKTLRPSLTAPPRLRVMKLSGDRRLDAIKRQSRTQVRRNR